MKLVLEEFILLRLLNWWQYYKYVLSILEYGIEKLLDKKMYYFLYTVLSIASAIH